MTDENPVRVRPKKYQQSGYREISWPAVARFVLPALSACFVLAALADVFLYVAPIVHEGGMPSALPMGAALWFIAALLCWVLLGMVRLQEAVRRQIASSRMFYVVTRSRSGDNSVEGICSSAEEAQRWIDAHDCDDQQSYSVKQCELGALV